MNQMDKQNGVSFSIPHIYESLGNIPKTTMQSKGAREGDRASSDRGSFIYIVTACRGAKMSKHPQWYLPT